VGVKGCRAWRIEHVPDVPAPATASVACAHAPPRGLHGAPATGRRFPPAWAWRSWADHPPSTLAFHRFGRVSGCPRGRLMPTSITPDRWPGRSGCSERRGETPRGCTRGGRTRRPCCAIQQPLPLRTSFATRLRPGFSTRRRLCPSSRLGQTQQQRPHRRRQQGGGGLPRFAPCLPSPQWFRGSCQDPSSSYQGTED